MKLIAVVVALSAAIAVPAAAQTKTSPAKPAAKSAAKPAAASPDMAFAREAAIGGMAEVELGNLAKQKASSNDVKQFGDRMVTDHGKGGDELKQWAQSKNLTLPAELDAKHKALRDRLAKLPPEAFDRQYMNEMVMDHQHDVMAFKREAASGKDADLKAWAARTLPTLEEHLKMAKDAAMKVGASAGGAKKSSEVKGRGGR
jgi:putative membrane protein